LGGGIQLGCNGYGNDATTNNSAGTFGSLSRAPAKASVGGLYGGDLSAAGSEPNPMDSGSLLGGGAGLGGLGGLAGMQQQQQ